MFNALSALRRLRLRSLADELEIERLTAERDDFRAKFKLAATDLAKQAEEIDGMRRDLATRSSDLKGLRQNIAELHAEINSLRPDALKWRNSLKRSHDRKRAAKSGDRK